MEQASRGDTKTSTPSGRMAKEVTSTAERDAKKRVDFSAVFTPNCRECCSKKLPSRRISSFTLRPERNQIWSGCWVVRRAADELSTTWRPLWKLSPTSRAARGSPAATQLCETPRPPVSLPRALPSHLAVYVIVTSRDSIATNWPRAARARAISSKKW